LHASALDPPALEIPAWVPPPVRSCVLHLVKQLTADFPDVPAMVRQHTTQQNLPAVAIVLRLATSPEMRNVWRELERRQRRQRRHAPDKALEGFIVVAWINACAPPSVETPKDRAALAAPLSSAAERCRWAHRHDRGVRRDPELARALLSVADYFEECARKVIRCRYSPLIVKHRHKDDQARAYVRVLGDHTRTLFGSALYRTVATTASVALQQKIDWQQVRQWLKP
jgi:hypothetical protein